MTIGPILANKDVFAQAETGSGKTGAFVIPIIEKFLRAKKDDPSICTGMRFVVLSPTRELAQQTQQVFNKLGALAQLTSCCVIGGENIDRQKKIIADGASVLVATPGRLVDLIKQKFVNLSKVNVMVFDEADRLFDMGFQKDIEFILSKSCRERQLIMLSATSNQEVLRTAYKFNSHPEELTLNHDSLMVDHVQHKLAMISAEEKFPLLVSLLRKKEEAYAIVFCNTQVQTHTVAEWLIKMGLKAKPISGRLPQNKRTKLLEDFREKKVTILVCTDVAARGLDIKNVNFVINYDLPQEAANYVHRIGRTGRAGAEGEAISFCAFEDCEYLDGIKELIEANIESLDLNDDDFATDICPRPRIDRKSLKLIDSTAHGKTSLTDKNNSRKLKTMSQTKNQLKNRTYDETQKRNELYKPEINVEKIKDATTNTQVNPPSKRIDRRFLQKEGHDIQAMMPELLSYFRIQDKSLIGHEVLAKGRKKYFFFGPQKTTYKFFVKPIYKRLLLPLLIEIINKAKLKLFVKISYKAPTLQIYFSGEDESLLTDNRNELLRAFEQIILVYLQSRVVLHKDIQIVLKGGKTKVETQNKRSDKDDKNFERKLRGLAQSKRKIVLETNESVTLTSLNARERRIIHLYFENDEKVGTSSIGEGRVKNILIEPRL